MPFELDRVVEILDSSSAAPQLMARLVEERVNKSAELLTMSLARFSGSQKIDRVLAIYGALDQAHQLRVLMSSELGEVMSVLHSSEHAQVDESAVDTIHDIVAREHALWLFDQGIETDYLNSFLDDHIFSPMGDRALHRTPSGWLDDETYLIDDLIAVDFDSPLARRHEPDSGTLSNPRLALSEDEKRLVLMKLSTALHNMDRGFPIHGQIIRNFVRRIVVRKSIESDVFFRNTEFAPFGSEHRPIHPSSLRMLNVQHPQYSMVTCMESLLHEAIHNVLAYWETVNGYFATSARDVRPVSPWSGNAIPNHSLAHAVFVWYGLHRQFQACAVQLDKMTGVDSRDLFERLRTMSVGFLVDKALVTQFTFSEPMHDALARSINGMQANIRAFYATQRDAA